MTTYTVFSAEHGTVYGRGLTAVEAMDEILTYDGYRYEIRETAVDSACWELWHSDGSRNSTRSDRHMVKTVVFSLEADEGRARQEIAELVIKARWPRLPACMTDEEYDAMQIAADQADDQI